MKNLKAQYNLSSVQGKQYLLGSIFPENIEISSLVEQRGGKSKHFDNDLKEILDKLNRENQD